jgi:hypothetical protein
MIYKVSYVILGGKHPGAIINQREPPQIEEKVQLGELWCDIVEIKELIPTHDEVVYLHVTCRPTTTAKADEEMSSTSD